jgi:preprotein translocase subunit YajC
VSFIYTILVLLSMGLTADTDAPAKDSAATTGTAASAPAAPEKAKGDKGTSDSGKAAGQGANPGPANGDQGGGSILPYTLIIIVVLGYFLIVAPERKKSKAFKDQMSSIKKNDKVVTIGGIQGIVTNIDREHDKITLRVDDTTNTKIDFTLGAISRVLSTENSEKDKDKDKDGSK